MKILSWNCNGALRNKLEYLSVLDADIAIIQECENPQSIPKGNEKYHQFAQNSLWCGSNKSKGLGVFAKNKYALEKIELNHNWRGRSLQWFLPFRVNNKQNVLALWNHHAKAKAFPYIGQFWLFMQNNKEFFKDLIIVGDFNSNTIWDKWDRWWNHSDCVNELKKQNIESVYHVINKVDQGLEKQKTFYLQRNVDKGYHIDYIFVDKTIINKTKYFNILDFNEWKAYSDHVPIIWEYEEI